MTPSKAPAGRDATAPKAGERPNASASNGAENGAASAEVLPFGAAAGDVAAAHIAAEAPAGAASIADARGYAHCHRLRVRYAETDAMGIVYHANYVTFFEVGRVEYLRAAGIDYRALEDQKMTGAVVEVVARYHAPARFDDELTICTRCSSMGKARFRMEYEIWRESDRTLIVSGHTEHALLSHLTLRPVRIPDEVRSAVDRFEAARSARCAPVPGGNGRSPDS